MPVFVYARSRLAYRTVLTRYRNADRVVLIALPITVLGVYLVCAVNRKYGAVGTYYEPDSAVAVTVFAIALVLIIAGRYGSFVH